MSPAAVWTAVAAVFGLLVGSFLNVVVFRLPRECMSIVKPRSRCIRCLRLIEWYDNFPVVSWLVLGGKCRGCKARISFRYPFVELLTGAAFAYSAWTSLHSNLGSPVLTASVFLIHAYVISAMIAATFIDLDFEILPDEITISGFVLGIIVSAALPEWHMLRGEGLSNVLLEGTKSPAIAGAASGMLGAVVGAGAIYLVGIFGKIVFRKKIEKLGETEAMGFGDVKYLAFLGAFLGWQGILLTFLVACFYGSVFGIGKAIIYRRMGYVPFGPFLSAGAATMLFFSPQVYGLIDLYLSQFSRPLPA